MFAFQNIYTKLFCNACEMNKSHKLSSVPRTSYSTFPLNTIHSDAWVNPTHPTNGYYIMFTSLMNSSYTHGYIS